MANLACKNGIFVARFRYAGREYQKSLKTRDRSDAKAALLEVERAIHRLTTGLFTIPPGVDAGDFIISGGTRTVPVHESLRTEVTVSSAINEYVENLRHIADSHRATRHIHLKNFIKILGAKSELPIGQVAAADLEDFLQSRLRDRSSTTVSKERSTLIDFFTWAVKRNLLARTPAADLSPVKGAAERPRFRTMQEIDATLARGGMNEEQIFAEWKQLFLAPREIADLLRLVRARSKWSGSFLLHAVPAYTGVRRGELLRLRWADVDLQREVIEVSSRKQSRQTSEVRRQIDVHPELREILADWRMRSRGQFVIADPDTLQQIGPKLANSRFWAPMRSTPWCLHRRRNLFKVGFHTYRHSFASNLAAAGVDQRVIDEILGHQTDAMRRRYRHLFPERRREAVASFSFKI